MHNSADNIQDDSHLIPQSGKENSLNVKRRTKSILDNVEKISTNDRYTNKIYPNSQSSLVETDQTSKINQNLDAKDCQGANQDNHSQFVKTNFENKNDIGSIRNLHNSQDTYKGKVSHKFEFNSNETTDVEENFLLDKIANSKYLHSHVLSEEKLVNYDSDVSTDIEDLDEKFNSNFQNTLSIPLSDMGKPYKSQQRSEFSKLGLSFDRVQLCKASELSDNENEKEERNTSHMTTLNAIRRNALKTPLQNSDSDFFESPVLDYSCFRFVDKITVACSDSENEARIQNEVSFLITTSPYSHLENENRPDSVDSSKDIFLFSLTSESEGESIKKSKRVKKKKRKTSSRSHHVKCLDFTRLEDSKENKGKILELSNSSAELDCKPTLALSSQGPQNPGDLNPGPIFKDSKVLPNRPQANSAKKPIETASETTLNELKSQESCKVPNSTCEAPIQSLKSNHSKKISPSTSMHTEENPTCSRASPVGSKTRIRRMTMTKRGNIPIITPQKNEKSQTNARSSSIKQEHLASSLLSLKSPKEQSDSKQEDNSISKERVVKTKLTLKGDKLLKDCEELINSKVSLQDCKKFYQEPLEEIRETNNVNLVAIKDTSLNSKRSLRNSKKVDQELEEIRETDNVSLGAIKETSFKPKRSLRSNRNSYKYSEVINGSTSHHISILIKEKPKTMQKARDLCTLKSNAEKSNLYCSTNSLDQTIIAEALPHMKDAEVKILQPTHESLLVAEKQSRTSCGRKSTPPSEYLPSNTHRSKRPLNQVGSSICSSKFKKTCEKICKSLTEQENVSQMYDNSCKELFSNYNDPSNKRKKLVKEEKNSNLTPKWGKSEDVTMSNNLFCSTNSLDQTIIAVALTHVKDAEVKVIQPTHKSLLVAEKQSQTSCGRKSIAPNRYSPSEHLPSNTHRSKRPLNQVGSSICFSKFKKTCEQSCKSLTQQKNVSQMYDNSCKELCSDHNDPSNKRKKLVKEEKNSNLTPKRGKNEDVTTLNLKETRTRTTTTPHIIQRQTCGMKISDSSKLQHYAKISRVSEENDSLEFTSDNLSLLSSPQPTKIENSKDIGVSNTTGKMYEILCKPQASHTRGKKQINMEEESEAKICFMSVSSPNSSHHSTRGRIQSQNSSTSKRSEASSQRQALASKHPRILFTGFKDPKDEKVVKDFGGLLVETATNCSVLVTNAIKRTCKFIACLGKGIPIVSRSWIIASKQAGTLVDPWKYLVMDKEAEKKFGFSLKESLEVASKRRLLTGYSIYVTDSVKPPPNEMKEIVACAGGEFLENVPVFSSPKTIIISCQEDKKLWTCLKKLKIAIVNTEFILSGLLKQKILIKENKLA